MHPFPLYTVICYIFFLSQNISTLPPLFISPLLVFHHELSGLFCSFPLAHIIVFPFQTVMEPPTISPSSRPHLWPNHSWSPVTDFQHFATFRWQVWLLLPTQWNVTPLPLHGQAWRNHHYPLSPKRMTACHWTLGNRWLLFVNIVYGSPFS